MNTKTTKPWPGHCQSIAIDLVDSVEMLDIVLDERIPKEFGYAMIAAACVSFLLTLLQIVENKLHMGTVSLRKEVAILANVLQIFLVNLPSWQSAWL